MHHAVSVRGGRHQGCGEAVSHAHCSMAVFLEGTYRFSMRGAWTLGVGDVLLVPDGEPHHALDDGAASWIGVGVCGPCLPPDRWGPAMRQLFEQVRAGGCPVLRPPDFPQLVQHLQQLERELQASGPGSEWAVDGLLSIVTATLLRATPAQRVPPSASTPLVARVLAWISAHALEPISLVDVAEAVGRAPTHVAAQVKKETGHPVGHWILGARMAVARDLLFRTEENVEVVAERVGYASASHFHRTFRRVHGLAPDAWRRAHR